MMTNPVYARPFFSLVANGGSVFNCSKMKPLVGKANAICPSWMANGLNDFKTNYLEGKGKAFMGLSSSSSLSVVNVSSDFEARMLKLLKYIFEDLKDKHIL